MSGCCNEFSRSSLMRKAVAQAGSVANPDAPAADPDYTPPVEA